MEADVSVGFGRLRGNLGRLGRTSNSARGGGDIHTLTPHFLQIIAHFSKSIVEEYYLQQPLKMATTVDKVHVVHVGMQAFLLICWRTTDQGYRGRDGQDAKEQGYELPFGSIEG